jgi:hypothetical protein
MADFSYALIFECFNYIPETGQFFWKKRPVSHFQSAIDPDRYQRRFNSHFALKQAFQSVDNKGYRRSKVFGVWLHAQRVAWLLTYGEWPNPSLNFINGDRTDNRITNLVLSDRVKTGRNRKKNHDTLPDRTGVHWHIHAEKWISNIGVNGRLVHLGYFDTINDAIKARKAANKLYGFSDRHGS